jgi:class 3 adenylate cyclase/RecA/RadA recombinase
MEAERRPVTILFADLVGFTAFTERSGEEAAYVLMEAIHRLMERAVEAHGGTIKEATGDGVIALFGVPFALEDAPLRACRAALSIQQCLAEEVDAVAAGVRPQLRISINTGAVIVGPVEEGAGLAVFGDTVNTAARLQACAPPGAILLSEATRKLVLGLVDCEFVGLCRLKGKAEPQPAYRLDAIRQRVSRFQAVLARGLSPYVGRAGERKRLEGLLCGGRRRLRVIDIVGEPGIGKSRLLHTVLSGNAESEPILSGSCSPDGSAVPFLPLIDVVRGCLGIAEGEDQEGIARKLAGGLAALELFSVANVDLLLNLLGLAASPEGAAIGLRTGDLLRRLLQARCRRSPLVVLIEDLQWIDSASEEVLTQIVATTADASRLVLIHTRRPEYLPPWIDHASTTTVPLSSLSAAETSCIAQARLGGGELPGEFARLIVERAGGNPLFAEEIAGSLLERRIVRRGAAGLQYEPSIGAAVLPLSVHSLLAARIDGLDPRDRALLRSAAAIGYRFDADILGAVIGDDGGLDRRLAALQQLGLLQAGDGPRAFVFKHALVRDALYDSLLAAPRAALHLRIGSAIERRSSDRRIEAAEIVAGRWRTAHGAGKASSVRNRAAATRAGTHCLKEAERHFALALQVAATFPFGPTTRGSTSLAAPVRAVAVPEEKTEEAQRNGRASGSTWSMAGLGWLDKLA